MAARYTMDKRGFEEHVLCSPWMLAEMEKRGRRVLDRARLTAPFDPDDPDGIHYVEAFELEVGIKHAVGKYGPTKRAAATIRNTDMPTALFVEYGRPAGVDKNGDPYPKQERHRTLGNALDAAKD
jgi:hypothetical protein